MTREEAIYCLKSYQPDAPDDMCKRCKYYESIKLAPNVYTCISDKAREMAIQALEKENIYDDKEHYVTISKALYDKLNIDYEQALSQEPCDDMISRDAALEKMADYVASGYADSAEDFLGYSRIICQLPPVTPQPKTGHWITWKEAGNEIASETKFECSVCHDSAQTLCNGLDLLSKYCPNCGAKMVEPQESNTEKHKPCVNYEDGCEEWAGCPCVRYKAESEE